MKRYQETSLDMLIDSNCYYYGIRCWLVTLNKNKKVKTSTVHVSNKNKFQRNNFYIFVAIPYLYIKSGLMYNK